MTNKEYNIKQFSCEIHSFIAKKKKKKKKKKKNFTKEETYNIA